MISPIGNRPANTNGDIRLDLGSGLPPCAVVVVPPVATVTVTRVVAPRGALVGDTTHVAFTGAPVQLSVALPLIPAAERSSSG